MRAPPRPAGISRGSTLRNADNMLSMHEPKQSLSVETQALQEYVRLKQETDRREGNIADVFTFRDGKAIEKRSFIDSRQALEWVGVGTSDEI